MKNPPARKELDIYLITFFSSFVVPFLMTSAHENHLFLATVLAIPILSLIHKPILIINLHLILILQFVNLYGYYGLGDINWRINYYSYEVAYVLSFIACFCFCLILLFILAKHSLFTYLPDEAGAEKIRERTYRS